MEVITFEEFVRERERERPGFRALLDAAVHRQELMHALAARRRSLGMSQPEVARLMRTSQPAVARLEAGDGNPRFSTIERYATAVGLRIEWRLIEQNPATPSDPEGTSGGVLRDIIRDEPTKLSADAALMEAVGAIAREGGVVVMEPHSDMVRGVVTSRETVHALAEGRDLSQTTLSDVCIDVTVGAEDPLDVAKELMLYHDLRRLPVLDEANRPVGLVSMADVERELAGVGV